MSREPFETGVISGRGEAARRAGSVSHGCLWHACVAIIVLICSFAELAVEGVRRLCFRLVFGVRRLCFRFFGGGFACWPEPCPCISAGFLAFVILTLSAGHALGQQGAVHPDGILAREDPVVEPVGLADWPKLDKALKKRAPDTGRIVSFRELWQADPKLADEPLVISGVVYRRFRTEPRGQFPSLEELWIRTDDDGLAVVTNVVPPKSATPDIDRTEPGSAVRLVAWFIRKIRYEAEDEPRIAPWLASAGFEKASETGGETSPVVPEQANDKLVFFVILAVIGAITLLRIMLLWSDRSRRRTEAWRATMRQNTPRPSDESNEPGRPLR